MPGLGVHACEAQPSRANLAGKLLQGRRAVGGLPGSPGATWATTRVPAHYLPILPSCSSSSLLQAVAEEEGNPAPQLLPSAAGVQEGEGAKLPAEQLKITKYFPNIIRFPCKQLP